MPYRVSGKCVEVERDGKWEKLKCHESHEDAVAHHRALEANVDHGKAVATILKYGRVLSRANEQEITGAVNALITVLQRAGINLQGEPMDEKAIEEKLKQLDPETAQQLATLINEFVQQVDSELGITEALQGQEQPVDEDGNPVEENPDEPPPDEEKPREGEQPREEDMPPDKKKPPRKSKMGDMPMGGVMRPTQAETNYTPHTEEHGSECEHCRWFVKVNQGGPYCHLIENYPMDILPTGHCDRWEMMPEMEMEPMPITVVEMAEAAVEEERVWQPVEENLVKRVAHRVMSALGQALDDVDKSTAKDIPDSNFQVFKAGGCYQWLSRHTNNFEDRDKEILSGASHDAYVARVNMGLVDKPELWVWHSKGSRVGQADVVWTHRPKDYPDLCFVFALGHFDDDPISQRAAKSLERRQGRVELSHGFTYPTWALKHGVYSTYNTFEISVLPERMAANPYTAFEEIQAMALTDKQRQWIKETGGDELLARVERAQTESEKDGETLKALDKRYKDFADAIQDNGTDTMAVDLKQVLKVVAELIDAQGAMEAERATEKAAYAAAETKLAAVQTELDGLRRQLDKRPRSGARAKETEIEGQSDLAKALEKVTDDYEMHPVWGPLKPKA